MASLCTPPPENAAVFRHFQTNLLNAPVPEITISFLTPSQIKRLLKHHKSNYTIDGISSRMTIIFVPELMQDCFEIFFKTTVGLAIDAFWFDGFENCVEIDSKSSMFPSLSCVSVL